MKIWIWVNVLEGQLINTTKNKSKTHWNVTDFLIRHAWSMKDLSTYNAYSLERKMAQGTVHACKDYTFEKVTNWLINFK